MKTFPATVSPLVGILNSTMELNVPVTINFSVDMAMVAGKWLVRALRN